ncbi:23S rRNA (pseudouridine1915-N3)-methyltransferase [Spiroplasma helicoides]|uniref:Ribosomal RNA large subunit methyltransferase H n=1 Tax=Spiroplasma helicoides TaxID=216938 RepID=A0A1B3SJX0_9MOLU|nr:23S rRNA (pseudouridine(1915)-N(3))-methyltransferase RlmH [Spiroplasma helicoides]AOG60233.1 23S rRNA (pseudouridine1915-N3)-methyltransferase [Spiroplasma helicoides]
MNIKILCYNKLHKEYKEIYNYFLNKLKNNVILELIEIDEAVNGDLKLIQNKNEEAISKKLNNLKDYEHILLEISASQSSSEDFAKMIENNKDFKGAKIAFIIGPSDGFSQEFRQKYNNKLSFGKITLPYNLVRIILLEQIYRSIKIIKNEPYHK